MSNVRLLGCAHCKTVEVLPDFDGPPEYDDLLNNLVTRHRTPEGHEHIGMLFVVTEEDWAKDGAPATITRQIAEKLEGGETGLGSEFYNLKQTFQEDALQCFNEHLRNPACSDYKDDSKILRSGQEKELEKLGIHSDSKRWLCEFCPVHSLVEQAQRRKAGLDK